MRTAMLATTLLIAACTPKPLPDTSPICDPAKVAAVVGRTVGAGAIEAARRASGASKVRVIRPGNMVTMDYRADRLNLEVDANGRVTSARCG